MDYAGVAMRLGTRRSSVLAVAVIAAAIASASALASPPPDLVAKLTGATIQHRRTVDLVTVTFTIGERGKRPGTGIPPGSVFLVTMLPAHGAPAPQMVQAHGKNGHFTVSAFVPHGGIRGIEIGGWLNRPKGMPTAAGGFFLPITVVSPNR